MYILLKSRALMSLGHRALKPSEAHFKQNFQLKIQVLLNFFLIPFQATQKHTHHHFTYIQNDADKDADKETDRKSILLVEEKM